ncbi:ATP-binding cassette sub-family A member 2-like isoform X1 [Haliotis cracherodii]|uniref:ATP-binding cassette sub-family A member 2-like isoform X1 n=1 Tax=Haliotis cracherodii TaxID=6455 RepID=UPI0039E75254
MGFFHQLKLLLWKNFTLKIRRPFVLLFELFIPLVLFVILLMIRKKLPANPQGTSHFRTMPLPSSGLVSIMQMFCENGHTDEHGFLDFPSSSSTTSVLKRLQVLAENRNFFDPGFTPEEMNQIPDLYKSIIDDPAFLHDQFKNASDFEISQVLPSVKGLVSFLHNNLSLPREDIDTLLNSTVHVQGVYKYLFGDDMVYMQDTLNRQKRSADAGPMQDILQSLSGETGGLRLPWKDTGQGILKKAVEGIVEDILERSASGNIDNLETQIFEKIMSNPKLLEGQNMAVVIEALVSIVERLNTSFIVSPDQMAQLLKMEVFSPSSLRKLSCDPTLLVNLFIPETHNESLIHLQKDLCNMTSAQFQDLSAYLRSSVTDQDIVNMLNLKPVNLTSTAYKISNFITKVNKFVQFHTELEMLAKLVEMIPQDAFDIDNTTDAHQGGNETTPAAGNTTDTTPTKIPTVKPKAQHPQGLLKLWSFMQQTVCGTPPPTIPTDKDGNPEHRSGLDALSLSSRQHRMLGILLHVLYSNPKVLYAPANTSADDVMIQANASFAFIDLISDYARTWLNVSVELKEYLEEPQTAHNLDSIREMQHELKEHRGMLGWMFQIPQLSPFLNETVPTSKEYLHSIQVISKAAHSWLTLMDGISLNVFQGFDNETAMVQYFLNEAYHDNVSVLAGVVFENIGADGSLPPHIRYKIRQNATFTPTTKFVRKQTWYPGPGPSSHPYYEFGFVWIQDIVERAIIDVQVERDVVEPGTYAQQFPYPCFMYDQFVFMIEHVMPLCLTISWVYSVAMLVQSIVYEKEQRLKEVMKMMGMNNAVHWCAWFLTTFLQMSITVGVLTAMFKYGRVLAHSDPLVVFMLLEVYVIATISLCFLISVLYSKAKVAAACAGIIYFLSYVPYMYVAIKEDIAGDRIPGYVKSLVSLSSTTAFGLGAKYFAYYEEMGVGVQWDNIYRSPVEDDEYTLFMVILMIILDSFLYGLLVWYIEHVFPGSYGLSKPWYFPFTKSYWCGSHVKHTDDCTSVLDLCRRGNGRHVSVTEEDQACAMAQQSADQSIMFEQDPIHLPEGVCIDNLTKVYKLGKKTAIKNLSLNFYEGQITSFLGHNGAGKTTTMSILTGLIPPTSGYATIYGLDIRSDMDVIRQSLGMCPQHNVLFDKLTVEEHLWFYAQLKGMKSPDIKIELDRMIKDLDLPNKRHTVVDSLSGGMQRKLSVAIAFVGGSRTVILDEPTAGIDPYARRAIWELLMQYKEGRTIILSTHHMDEADILGDRVAIINNGQLKCCGSSIFLKNSIGEGYHLTVVKEEPTEDNQDADTSCDELEVENTHHQPPKLVSPCKEAKVTEFIQKYVPTVYLVSESKRELHYILPFEEAKKKSFEKLFQAMDSDMDTVHIISYGVKDTTLEEVFLKVTEAGYQEEESREDEPAKPLETLSSDPSGLPEDLPRSNLASQNAASLSDLLDVADDSQSEAAMGATGITNPAADVLELGDIAAGGEEVPAQSRRPEHPSVRNIGVYNAPEDEPKILLEGRGSHILNKKLLLFNHFRAVIVKRFHYITRNWRSLFSQIILPAIFVAIAMTVALAAPSVDDLPPLVLSPSQYFNVTQPKGNFIPFTNERMIRRSEIPSQDADAEKLIRTLFLPSGVGATCVLQKPFNSSFDVDMLKRLNYTQKTYELLSRYYEPECRRVFAPGIHLDSYIPPEAPVQRKVGLASEDDNSTVDFPIDPSYSTTHFYPHCVCRGDKTGFKCNKNHAEAPKFRVVTQDILQNITGQRTEDFILYTTQDYRLHRYGVLSFGLEQRYVPENFGRSAPTLFRKLAVRSAAKLWFNNKGYHSMAVYLNTINNAILRANLPKSKGNPAAFGITAINHPWNDTNNEMSTVNYMMEGSDVLIAIFIIVAMSFVPASFVVFLVYEKSTKAKHLQFVTGINPVMYWLGNYVWDMANYTIPAFMCVMVLLIFQIPAYVSTSNLPAVVALFLMYGWSITPVMYPASFLFNEPSTAYICLIVINLFTGITCIVSSFLLELFSYDKDLNKVHDILKIIFMMFPNYCLGRGLMDLAFNEYKNEFYFKTGQYDMMKSPMEWSIIPVHLVAMTVIGLIAFLITLLCEYKFFIPARYVKVPNSTNVDEDVDVAAERKRVLKGTGRYDMLRLENLTKVYKTAKLGRHLAVDKLCLGVPPGECFGLLGVNGAGKTTTFKMLTGDLRPTSGCAYLNGHSVIKELNKVQQSIGYCPQFDSLYDELTAREHLQFYCRLRGVSPKDEKQVVNWALSKLGLSKYADKLSGTYSGGNKRKLSTAIALIGHPQVIFMDEPTTGMDPHSRRFLWDLILSLIQDGRSVILTSHSMEECEVLCTRLAIMVNGHFKCLGSIQHLKNKYGDGYTFSFRLKGPNYEQASRGVVRFVERNIPAATLKEQHFNLLQYELQSESVSLAHLFSTLELAQQDLHIEDYSVSQNTLDNVFINFVKQQMEIVQEDDTKTRQRSRTRARSRAAAEDDVEPLLLSEDDGGLLHDDDDDLILRLDQSNGTRLTILTL